jgi:hypothetical protein
MRRKHRLPINVQEKNWYLQVSSCVPLVTSLINSNSFKCRYVTLPFDAHGCILAWHLNVDLVTVVCLVRSGCHVGFLVVHTLFLEAAIHDPNKDHLAKLESHNKQGQHHG